MTLFSSHCVPNQSIFKPQTEFFFFFLFTQHWLFYFLMTAVCVCIGSAFCSTAGCMKPTFYTASGGELHCLICFKTAQFSSPRTLETIPSHWLPEIVAYEGWQMHTHEYLTQTFNKTQMQKGLTFVYLSTF